jgi:hypothetical protein
MDFYACGGLRAPSLIPCTFVRKDIREQRQAEVLGYFQPWSCSYLLTHTLAGKSDELHVCSGQSVPPANQADINDKPSGSVRNFELCLNTDRHN